MKSHENQQKNSRSLQLSSVLLIALVVPFIMNYSLSVSLTPYWLFSLIFLVLVLFIGIDIAPLSQKIYSTGKQILLWLTILLVLGSAFGAAIVMRHKTAPVFEVHDIILQQESAIRYLLDGKNPYATSYIGTPLKDWFYSNTEENPALYHFVMQPFYLIFALPFYAVSLTLLGYFDGRMPLFFLLGVLLILASRLVHNLEKRLLFVIFLAFTPAMLPYTLEGRSDIFMFTFLFAGLYLLFSKKLVLSGIFIALAFAVKQSVWPLFPFYALYLYKQSSSYTKGTIQKTLWALLRPLGAFTLTFLAIVVPFYLWDPKAYIGSTILYLSGNVEHSYPISGYGFGKLLEELGVITDLHAYYPFIYWQIAIALPVMIILLWYVWKKPSVKNLIVSYGIFLFVYWYFSRYFNNSHLGYLSLIFVTAYFWPESSETNSHSKA